MTLEDGTYVNAHGDAISRYEILELLGIGGWAKCTARAIGDLDRDVAIKFLPQPFANSPERLARFGQEARTASSLNHPNIITIHEIGTVPGGPPYIVMEYVQGHTLRALLQEAPSPGPTDSGYCFAARRRHGQGARRGDRASRSQAGKCDGHRPTGLSRSWISGWRSCASGVPGVNPAETRADTEDTALSPDTVVGALVGTAAYMSPEQARGEHADFHADQFAMGVMAYEMATGRPPFRGPSVVQTLAAIIETEPDPHRGFAHRLPAGRPDDRRAMPGEGSVRRVLPPPWSSRATCGRCGIGCRGMPARPAADRPFR